MIRRLSSPIVLLNAVSAATLSAKTRVEDFRHLHLYVQLAGATTTMKVKASDVETVDFSAPSTISNPWYYVDLKGLGDGATTVEGDTGIAVTTTTSAKAYAINVDFAKWIAVDASVLSAGTVSVMLTAATNE
jgi:hypothetical protein